MRARRGFVLAALLALSAMPVAMPAVGQTTTRPVTPLSLDTLAGMYRTELGPLFDPATVARLDEAHKLLEQYFAADSSDQRKAIVQQLDATGVAPPILGRMARLRMYWQKLEPGVYFINEQVGPHAVRYFLGVPRGYDQTQSWPLVVKLPTANAFLTDPPPDADGVTRIYTQWIEDELADHSDALVLMPLLNLDELYGPGAIGMNLVMQPILHAAGQANIDPARVYLIGHSMAAHAVWNIAIHYPTYFAAINPLAGSANEVWQRIRLGDLRNVLPVVWHDASDTVIKVDESRAIVRYLRGMKYDVDYQETQSMGHAPTPQLVEQEYAKLRARIRALYPTDLFLQSDSPDTIFNRIDWLQIYQPLDPGPLSKLVFAHGSGGISIYRNGFRAVASVTAPNTISIDTVNVQTLRIYLNDQMVDLGKPVSVKVNGKTRFSDVVPQSIDEMLKDQIFLGRGWRYFTAIIDLDLTEPTSRPSSQPSTRRANRVPIRYTTPDGQEHIYVPHDSGG
jgi:hypothetical protein